jgi:hypothetical protein
VIIKVVCVPLLKDLLCDYGYSCSNLNWSSTYKTYLDAATTYDCHFHLQYIPAHVGIEPNKTIDHLAKHYASAFSPVDQYSANIELSAPKTTLKHLMSALFFNNGSTPHPFNRIL